jgi:hypothetical protein
MVTDTKDFYNNLQVLTSPIRQIVSDKSKFVPVPESWCIVAADIENSTQAVNEGQHQNVNLVAAGCIIAAINVAKKYNIDIPFVFGGDGATILVPLQLKDEVTSALSVHQKNSLRLFALNLKFGTVGISEVLENNHSLGIAKVKVTSNYTKAIFLGSGLKFAEKLVKSEIEGTAKLSGKSKKSNLNLTGLQCRWDKIKPPDDLFEILCLLVEAVDPKSQPRIYSEVLQKFDEIFGEYEYRHPISPKKLNLLMTVDKLKNEMLAISGGWNLFYLAKIFLETGLGKLYFKYNLNIGGLRGKEYLAQLVSSTDTLNIDGRINTLVCGTSHQRDRLFEYLLKQEKAGVLVFGHHISSESIMTCYIENLNRKHIHFIDGSNGGYTSASIELKNKINTLKIS